MRADDRSELDKSCREVRITKGFVDRAHDRTAPGEMARVARSEYRLLDMRDSALFTLEDI